MIRSEYSTTDHIHAINQLKEKCREYNIPLCVAFVDYEKAFDSVQTQAMLTSLQEQGIGDVYIQELSDESRRMMNIAKTKVMVVDNTPINVNNVLIENVPGYVFLGQHYSLKEKNQNKEIQRRIMAGWAAYAKHRDIFKSNLAICLRRQVYNSCVLPSYDILCRDLDADQTSTEQTCGRTDQNGKKYAQHQIHR